MELVRHLELLAEPVRVRLLAALSTEELAVGELVRIVQLPQSTVSRHLKLLRQAGWIARRAEGTAGWFRYEPDELPASALELWAVVRSDFEQTLLHAEDRARIEAVRRARMLETDSFFGRMHAQWEGLRNALFGGEHLLPTLLALLPPDLRVADLGCGTGEVLERLAPVVHRVIGVDRERAMLRAAAERVVGHANVELRHGALEDLPLDEGEVHAALLMLVLHHVEEPQRVLAEACRVVEPGGTVVILDMQAHERTEYRHTLGHRHLGFGEADVCEWARATGLDPASHRLLPPVPEAEGPPLFLAVLRRPRS